MKKITNKIIFTIITCASIISVASLTKTNAQEINRDDLTAYKTDMSSMISTEKRYYNAEYGISKGKDDSVKLILTEDKMLITGTIVDITVEGKGEMKDFASVEDLPYYNDKTYREKANVRNHIGTLYIDEGVENVGDRFLEGIKVHTATFPKTIKSIGENAFLNSNLGKVIISGKDIIIKDKAFFGCKYLNIISIKGKNVTIGNEVFSGTNIKKITLPEGTKSIGKKVFSNCKNLESVTIPNTVQNVGEGSFSGCSNLTSITIPEGVTSIENNMFSGCSSLTSITIPSSVTSIGSDAFSGCSSLTSIIIPEGVTSIGDNTFLGCTNLTNITIPSSVTSIGNNAFSGCSNLTSITIPEGVTSIGNNAFLDCNELTKIVIPERVETIGTLAFHGCNNLNNIVVEDKNTNYSSLNGILFNKDKTKLIKYPAKESSTEYTVPNTTTEICDKAFSYCSNLISITIPEGVTSIGNNVFDDCINLERIEVKTGNINYSSQNGILFNNDKTELIKYPAKKSSTEYTVPSTTNKICDTAFSNCNNLMNIYVEIANNTYTSENGILFNRNKTELIKYPAKKQANEYIISSTIKKIYDNAFENCVNLDNIEVNSENTNYSSENGILFNKNKTILIRYPAKKQDLEYTIPNTVTIVGDYAFSSCEGVKLITVPNTVTTLGKEIFSNVSKDLKIKTECNNKNIIEYANKYKISIERIHEYKFKKIMDGNKTILYTCKVCNADMEKEFNNTVDVSKNQDNSVIATVSDDNILIISGKGEMCERSKLSSPFEDNFNKIIINEGVTNIGKSIFQGMHNLEEVTIPSSVKIIEEYAFKECNSLSNIEIPEGVTNIGTEAFYNCTSLTDITISSSVTSIGNFAFYRCSLTTVEIPNSVITIGYDAFCGCKYLEEIIIPNSVTSIGASAFSNCNNLINVKILNDETINVGDGAFSGCINLKKVETHGSIESIKKQTFKDCENLEEVIINGKVNSIGVRAFDGCSSLTSITISGGVTIIDEYAFWFCKNLTNITTLEGLTSIGNNAFTGCSSLANIEIPNTVTNIGTEAFKSCSSLTNITIPGSVTTMGEDTFSECTLLKNIKILEGVTSIGRTAFSGCSSLTNITIPSSIKTIGEFAFYGCTSLPNIEIPSSVTIIGRGAFDKCSSLTNITIPKGVTDIGEFTFSGCRKLTSITIPEGVTSIGNYAFESCVSLTSIEIPNTVTSIGNEVFSYCKLTSIIIPEGVTTIGDKAFYHCSSLTNIEIPNTVTSIGNDAFLELPSKFKIKALCNNNYIKEYINTNQINCDLQLKHAEYEFAHINKEKNIIVYKCSRCEELYEDTSGTLAWDVSENQDETVIAVLSKDGTLTISGKGNMKDYTEKAPAPYCNNYKNIKEVIIKEGVTSIGDWAFNKCENFNNITIPMGITRIGNGAFSMNRLTSIIIPESVTSIGEQVFLSSHYTLSNIQVDKNNKNYSSEDGVLFNKEKTELIFCPEGKEEEIYTVPDSVETIGKYAFYFSGLTSVIIPESVTSIGEYAFYGSILINVTIPEGVKNIRDEAFSECNTLSNVTILGNETSVGKDVFTGCSSDLIIKTVCNNEAIKGYAEENSITTELIHNWGEWQTIEEATFAKEGTKQRTCANDSSHIETETIAKLDKSLLEKHEAKAATCEEAGNNGYYSYNGKYYSDSEGTQEIQENSWVIEALGHDWGEATYTWNEDKTECKAERVCTRDASHKETETAKTTNSVTKEATCEEVGERKYTATFTNTAFAEQTTTEEIKATGHRAGQPVEENRVESTCTQDGHYDEVIYCTVCNKEISRETKTIKAKGHTYSTEWTIDKEATCEETGEKSHHCTECGERTDITTIEALGHNYQIKSTTEAVCEKGGTIIYECTRCKTTKEETTPAMGHRAGQAVEENRVEATCTQEGYYDEVIYCTVCNKEMSRERKTIEKKAHTEVIDEAVEPTCTTAGKTEGKHCSVCNEVLEAQEEIPALGHAYGEATYTWNEDKTECTAERVCTRDASHKETETAKTTNSVTKEATCEEVGERTYTATFTNTAFAEQTTTEEIPATGHKAGTPVEENRVESTCTQEGHYDEVIYCTVCNKEISRKTKTIAKKAHTEVIDARIEPTCTTAGKTEGKHCSVCNEVLEAQEEIPALGHDWGEATYTWNEDKTECTAERICTRDVSHKETETVKTTNSVTKEATCEEVGERTYTATFTNTAFAEQTTTEEIKATGHRAGQPVEENRVESTCTQEGHYDEVIYCTVCNKEISRETKTIAKKAHTEVIDEAVEPTCTTAGKTEGKHCSVCNEVLEAQKEIPALGHTAGTPVEENRVESTCTQEGHYDEVSYCTVCNKEISRVQKTIKAKGHTYSTEWTIDKEATCEETGEKSHHCTECGERTDITTIEALGHDYQIKSTTEAVCEKGGTIIYECTRCKTTKEETTPALGHDYEEKIIEPTETEQGYTLHTCKRCGKEYKDNFVPAKKAPIQIKDGVKDTEIIEKDDQKYIIVTPNTSTEDLKEKIDSNNKYDINDKDNNNKNGNLSTGDKLIIDGDKNTNYKIIVKGDVNGDGKIDFMGDVVLLNNYRIGLIKLSTEALLAGDINQDGKIDFVEDVVKINNFRLNTIKSLNK